MSTAEPTNTPTDPLIDEVREIRRAISEQFGNDVDSLCDHLRELERQHPERVVEHVEHVAPGEGHPTPSRTTSQFRRN